MRLLSWYPLRVGLAAGIASLLPLLCARVPAANNVFALAIFAPIAAVVTAAPTVLGAALKNGSYVASGIFFGALLTSTALAAISAVDGVNADAATFVALVVLALLVLTPAFPPLASKFAMNTVIISLFSAADAPSARAAALVPLRLALSTLLGVAIALLVTAAPVWPDGRASTQVGVQLAAGELHAAATGALLARVGESVRSPGGGHAARVLLVRADAHRAAAAACDDALRALADTAAWEAWAGVAQPRAATARVSLLRQQLTTFDGAELALAATRAAEAQHARVMSRARLRAGGFAAKEAALLASAEDDYGKIDALLASPIRALGTAAAAALQAATAAHGGGDSRLLDAAEEEMEAALTSFDAQLLSARREIYYGPLPPSIMDPSLTSLGPPIEHYALFFCLRQFAETALRAVREARKPAATAEAQPGVLSSFGAALLAAVTVAPDTQRLIYAAKLVTAVVSAAWLGRLTCGSGLWSAITAQIVGAREGVFSGGSFRMATSRLTGTVLGAMVGYFLLSVLGHKPFGAELPLLALWVALCGMVRASPRTAYIGLVAQFTPYIIALDVTQFAVSPSTFAYRRVTQNLIGILAFVAVEFTVLPRGASALLLAALADTMRATAEVASAAWEPVLLLGANSSVAAAHAKLVACVSHARALLTEAADEPVWMRRAALLPPLHKLVQLYETALAAVLSLMHAAAAEAAVHGEKTLQGDIMLASSELRDALHAHFTTLAGDLGAGVSSGAAISAALAVEESMAAFEAAYDAALGRLRSVHLQDGSTGIPPTQVVLPLDALIFCTRQLVAVGEQVGAAVREALRSEADYGAAGGDEER